MAENVQQSIEVPVGLELFGSLVTEMNPSDLPEGISPDNQDVVYLPGGVGSRPCLHKWLSNYLPVGTTVTYEKTFVTPAGIQLNMILTSDGQMWVQDVNTPTIVTAIGGVTPGSYANSVSAFGKELFTFHDGSHGTDIPRIYDGQFFDRATQDGPAAPPTLANVSFPAVALGNVSVGGPFTATTGPLNTPINTSIVQHGSSTNTSAAVSGFGASVIPPGSSLTLIVSSQSGALWNGVRSFWTGLATSEYQYSVDGGTTWTTFYTFSAAGGMSLPTPPIISIQATITTLTNVNLLQVRVIVSISGNYSSGSGVVASVVGVIISAVLSSSTLVRNNNLVTGSTTTPHNLQVGYQALVAGVAATQAGGGIDSVLIDNEDNPGIATITTNTPHGLAPGENVFLDGILSNNLGITNYSYTNGVIQIETATNHNLSIGSSIVYTLGAGGVPTSTVVTGVISPTEFLTTINSTGTVTSTVGTVLVPFPLADALSDPILLNINNFTILTTPTSTTFTVAFNYSDGTWSSGTVSFQWDGTFYVTAVPSPTTFTYQQLGPNAITESPGTVTPYGQISPGAHTAVCLFITRSGLVTAPSPVSLQFYANGDQYVSVTDIPVGPPNVVARVIAFTGADGNSYFYIPYPAQVGGITVSTGTVIYDNTTTSALFDFSDNTLFDSTAIDIPGNNLFELRTLGPCLNILSYASRAAWCGYRNSIQNFLNLRFDGGYNLANNPLGWTVVTPGTLVTAGVKWGFGWQIMSTSTAAQIQITQPAYQDSYNAPILSPSTAYSVDLWGRTSQALGNLILDFYSPSAGLLSSATIPVSSFSIGGNYVTVNFSTSTPVVIPADTILRISIIDVPNAGVIVIDEIELFPTANPYTPTFEFSYVNFPEQLDNLTGVLGATDDDTPIQTSFIYRDSLKFLTQSGLHETNDIAGLEPQNWKVRQVSDHCGACSPRACDTGENFSVWVTSPSTQPPVGRGLYLYTGGAVYKLSQEIQPDFDLINQSSQSCIWVKNDSVTRRIYVGVPMELATAPDRIYVLDYRELDVASDLAARGPIHISFSGKMVCSDLSRKWTQWNVSANCGQIMAIPGIGIQFSVGGGNGETPGTSPGFANVYWFDKTLLTDDDYGQVVPYYTTYFFVNHEAETQLQVGLHRKLYKRYSIYITGTGLLSLIPYANSLGNPWPSPPNWPLSLTQGYDIGDGLNVSTERCAFRIGSIPASGSDNSFLLSKFIITLMQEPVSPIRFGAV